MSTLSEACTNRRPAKQEQAREPGEVCFLHSDISGRTYLYIEQQHGVRMAVLDATAPAKITLAASVVVDAPAPFDIVGAINNESELIPLP